MIHRTSELTGALLDAAVAKASGIAEFEVIRVPRAHGGTARCQAVLPGEDGQSYWTEFAPTTDWEIAGAIIDQERIRLDPRDEPAMFDGQRVEGPRWLARIPASSTNEMGPTALVAVCRAYVASKLGAEVEL